jgi:DNA polymerase-3 subunit delta
VLIVGAEEEEARRKTAVSAKLDAAIREFGMIVACRGLRDEALFEWIGDKFRQADKRASKDAIELLVSSVGSEMRALDLEIYKLINYVGDRHPVTAEDVTVVVATEPEDVMFKCVDAISKRHTDRALSLLHELHRHDPKPQAVAGRLLALLVRQYRLMWQAKHLTIAGLTSRDIRMLPADIAADLPVENSITQVSYKVGELISTAQKYTVDELRWGFERLVLCDLANKGGVTGEDALFSAEPASNLQLLVLQLTGVC